MERPNSVEMNKAYVSKDQPASNSCVIRLVSNHRPRNICASKVDLMVKNTIGGQGAYIVLIG